MIIYQRLSPEFGGTCYYDNFISRGESSSWNGCVTGSGTGLGALCNPQMEVLAKNAAGNYAIVRPIFSFDKSAVGSATVNSARLVLWVESAVDADPDGNDFITVVRIERSNVDSPIAMADYHLCGSPITNPAEAIGTDQRKIISTISSNIVTGNTGGTWVTFEFNSTGVSWLNSTTGVIEFCIREGHDVLNSEIADDSVGNNVFFASGDTGNAAYVPYLEVDTRTERPMIFWSLSSMLPFIFWGLD